LVVETSAGLAVIDSGLGPGFLGYGPDIGAQVGKFGDRLVEAGFAPGDVAAVVFTHLHQDHVRGATWSGRLTFADATGFAHAAEISLLAGPCRVARGQSAHGVRSGGDPAVW
jgi:glyoxylase-like metal-dependent hydrolase (beta-lactamase superfamily II)